MTEEKPAAGQDTGLIEKAFLMGIGAAMLAKEKTEELAEELIKRGTLTRDQSESFVNRVATQAEQASRSAKDAVAHETERMVAGVGLASAKDVDDIRAELTEIKALIASLRPGAADKAPDTETPPADYTL
jgi:polyhydroxyalkanoate synthesis regulator phasin